MKEYEIIDDYEELEQMRMAPPLRDVTAVSLDENMENEFIGQGSIETEEKPAVSKEASKVIASMDKLENRRVLLMNTVVGTGSVGRIVSGLYKTLEAHGYECLVAYGRGEAPEDIRSYRIGSDTGVYLHGGLSRITDRHGFYSSKATRELITVIEEFNPDIVHLHNIHGYYVNVKLLFTYLKQSGRRVIWTLHDCWSFTGHCTHFEYIGCQKWQTGCFHCEQLQEYPKSMVMDHSRKNYEQKKELFTGFNNLTIVTPSEWLAARVKQSFLQEYHTVVIPTGIDLKQFSRVEEERKDDNLVFQLRTKLRLKGKYVLLGVANPWRERKGLAQFETLAKSIGDKFVIILLGLNDDQLSELPHSIIGLAKTENINELAALYSLADIYVNLTLEDTFPTTNIEALACGTPVVTYKAGGSPESIDETCGIAVERNSVQGVLAAIDKIIALRNELYTPALCMKRARLYDKDNRFMEYVQEVYEGM